MWAYLLLPLAALAQDNRLAVIENAVPPKFIHAKDANPPPSSSERVAVQKQAAAWVKERATKKFKASSFHYIGDLLGRPADDLQHLKYAVYRMRFQDSPDVGGQLQADMLFYAQGAKIVWPRDDWGQADPPPGQMTAVIRNSLKD